MNFDFLFNKYQNFNAIHSTVLNETDISENEWEDDDLLELKNDLNTVKNSLSDYDINDWHKHTGQCNLAGQVVFIVRNYINPNICTQAWCKFYEILSLENDIIPSSVNNKQFYSVHLCEAPGAFISSLEHKLHLLYKSFNWKWLGFTLNPYYEGNNHKSMIDDDRFIVATLDNWYFGYDNTGNICNHVNICNLIQHVKNSLGEIDLVTADGSIDCSDSPGEQERLVLPIFQSEIITALLILKKGGCAVFKLFTFFESPTMSALYLLTSCFQHVLIRKPSTSKPGNSECYAICKQFQGIDCNLLEKLLQIRADGKLFVFKLSSFPVEFIEQNFIISSFFKKHQINTINSNKSLYSTKKMSSLLNQQEMFAKYWIDKLELYSIKKRVLKFQHLNRIRRNHFSNRTLTGSFNNRSQDQNKSSSFEESTNNLIEKIVWQSNKCTKITNQFCIGKNPIAITCSKFCSQSILFTCLNSLKDEKYEKIFFNLQNGFLYLIEKAMARQWKPEIVIINQSEFSNQSTTIFNKYVPENNETVKLSCRIYLLDFSLSTKCHFNDELVNKKLSIDIVLECLKAIRPGDSIIINFPSLLTRFNLQIVYLLSIDFENWTILSPDMVVMFSNLLHQPINSRRTFDQVSNQLKTKSVLSFLPLEFLFEKTIYSHFVEQNNKFLKIIINILNEKKN